MTAIAKTVLRWRLSNSNGPFTYQSFNAGQPIVLDSLVRGQSYEVQAQNVSARGTESNWVAVTHIVDNASEIPLAPTNLTGYAAPDGVHLTWSIPAKQPSSITYVIQYAVNQAGNTPGTWSDLVTTAALGHTVPVTNGQTFWFRVYANSFANVPSAYSNQISVKAKSVEDGADITGNHTANDTNHVAGATASSVSDGAGRAQAGFDTSGYLVANRHSIDLLKDGNYARVRAAALLGGSPLPTPNGKQVFGNPTFAANTIGTATGATFTSGPVVDGYSVYAISSNFILMWEAGSADPLGNMGNHPYMTLRSGTIANGGNAVCWMRAGDVAPCTPGQVFYMRVDFYQTWNVTPPSGVTRALRVSMQWYRSDGSNISGSESLIELAASGGAQTVSGNATAPAGAAYGIFYFGQTVYNNSGAAWAISPYPFDSRIHYASCISVQDLGAEVTGTLSTQRRMPYVTWANYGGMWNGLTISYTTTTTSCTFSASSASYVGGGDSIAYNSSSVTVSGSPGQVVTYYLYYDDPTQAGGSQSLQATTSQLTTLSANGRALLGKATVTYPTSGTGSGGGGTGCPQVDEPVIRQLPDGSSEVIRSGDVRVGDYILSPRGYWLLVTYSQAKLQPCTLVEFESGEARIFSNTAPLEDSGGNPVTPPNAKGCKLYHHEAGSMLVTGTRDVGNQWVQHITAQNDYFLVGNFSHHNMKPLQ